MSRRKNAVYRDVSRVLVLTLVFPALPVWAAPPVVVAPASGNTAVYISANGVTVIDVNTANGAGLSHNKYNDYNVPANGVVLNNANSSAVARQSQLAGLIAANKNLSAEAKVILNEVVSTNRSVMSGFTEVLGGRADVVVANPNGITCSGCGFINTDRVSLVTGTPNLAIDGRLRDFSVSRGDILIEGAGLNGSGQQYLDLVSRSLKVNGQINAPALRIATGSNVWAYANALVTGATTPEGEIPAFAFDSTVLGGMYAGRIAIVATEAGVGVRMQGEAAATAEDFSITSAGKIDIASKLSAKRDLTLASTATGSNAIKLSDANLSAEGNLGLTATGGATLSGGALFAGNNMNYAVETLSDVASASVVTDNNTRYAGGAMTLVGSGAASLSGVSYGALGALSASFASQAVGAAGATLYADGALSLIATTGDLALGNAVISSKGDMALTSDKGSIALEGGALVKSTAGKINMSVLKAISNAGKVTTDSGDIVLRVGDGVGVGAWRDGLKSSGEIWAGGLLDIAGHVGNDFRTFILSGSGTLRGDTVKMKVEKIELNDTSVLTSVGDMTLDTLDGRVAAGARILGASGGAGTLTLSVRSGTGVANAGLIHSGHDLVSTGTVGGSGGTVSAANDLALHNAQSVVRGNLIAGHDIAIDRAGGELVFYANWDGSPDAMVSAAHDVTISSYRVRNYATINAGNDIRITTSDLFWNTIPGLKAYNFTNSVYSNATSYTPQVIAGHAIFITTGGSDYSQNAGLISAPSVTITANSTAFVNIGTITGTTVTTNGTFFNGFRGCRVYDSFGTGACVTYGDAATGTKTSGVSPSATTLAPVSTPGAISFGGAVISLPTNPNGLYVPAQTPGSRFLVESNPLYLNMANFLGSDYLQEQLNKDPVVVPKVPELPKIPVVPKVPESPNTPELPKIPEMPNTPDAPKVPALSTTPELPKTPAAPKAVDPVVKAFDPELIVRRLGDAAYETFLVRQQLIGQTGSNMLSGYTSEYSQMKGLMDHAVSQVKVLGLSYGTGLTAAQQGALKQDMVWMVETTVNGQRVLAPVVYLAAATREMFDGSPLVTADTVNMNVTTLSNSGTIKGNAVNVNASGDVKNIGGTIKGGEISIASSGGSIINSAQVDEQVIQRDGYIDLKTTVGKAGRIEGTGTVSLDAVRNVENVGGSITGRDVNLAAGGDVVNAAIVATNVAGGAYRETIAGQGRIAATNDLTVQAGQDVRNMGSQMSAGNDTKIVAARDVTFDTVALTNRDIASSSSSSFTNNSTSRTITTSVNQVQSGLSSGANLTIKSGQDITLAAANVSAGKSATIAAAGDLNIVARSNSTQTVSESSASGVGVGDGVYGNEKKTTDQFSSRAIGSTLTTVKVGGVDATLANGNGGDIALTAGKTVTLEGAKVNSAGATSIAAQDVQILAARDVDRTTTTTETTSYLAIAAKGDGDKNVALSNAGSKSENTVKAGANASSTKDGGGVDLIKTTTGTTFDETIHSVGSSLASAGGLTINAKKDLTLQGAEVKAAGDIDLTARNVNILAAQDTHTTSSSTTTTRVGLYASTTNAVDAKAGAGVTASATVSSASNNAGATAVANAASSTNIDVVRSKTVGSESLDVTNQGSTLASGGNLRINSANTLTVQGSDLAGEQGVDLKARDIAFLAAQDTHSSSTSTSRTGAGLYLDGNANANASANAGANAGIGANAGVKSEAGVKGVVSAGVQARNTTSSESEGSSTARVSTITSGSGSISRQAGNSITDVGTAIVAAGDFSQSARTIDSRAAENTAYSSSDSVSNGAKIGVYGKAGAGVSADAGASAGIGGAKAGAGAQGTASVGAGLKGSYARDTATSGESSSDAVVSTIKAGGKVVSVSADLTRLEGTTISAGQGVAIDAGSLDFAAARSTTSSSSSAGNTNASASIGLSKGSGKGVDVDLAATTSKSERSASSSTASAGSIESGGAIAITTRGDTRLEGTNLAAVGDTRVAAGGNLIFDAARDTGNTDKSAYDASATVSTTKSSGGKSDSAVNGGVSGGFSRSSSDSSTATAGSITTGGTLMLTAGKAASFEGTNLAAGGDATIAATDGVTISAARSTASSESFGVRAGVELGSSKQSGAEGSSSSQSASATVEGNYSRATSSDAQAGSVSSGGTLQIVSGKDVTLEGTTLAATDKASIRAAGSVNFNAAESRSESQGFGASLSAQGEKSGTTAGAQPSSAAQKPPVANPTAPRSPGTGGTQGAEGSKPGGPALAAWQDKQGAVTQQIKDLGASPAAGSATPAPVASAGSAGAAIKGAVLPPAAVKATPPPVAADDSATSGEKSGSLTAGAQFQMKNKTTQSAGSISAGAGGVEIIAAGGDVNLVGTNIGTAGNADITAARDVNISATRNTESSFGAAVAVSADRKSETPAKPASAAAGARKPVASATPAGAAKAAPPVPGAVQSASARAGAAAAGKEAAAIAAARQKPTAKPAETVAVKPAAKPEVKPTAKPEVKPKAKPAATGSAKGAIPPVVAKQPAAITAAATPKAAAAAPAAEGNDANKIGAEASRAVSTNKDQDNKTDAFVGAGGGASVKNQGAAITTGGKVTIKSGGKTTLTNTEIKASGGNVIDAKGGIERRTVTDSSILSASTDTGPASTGQGLSKVPTASTSATTGAPVASTSTTDAGQNGSGAPQSAIKAAQGSTTGAKKQ